jgi:hypothetical protein
MKINARSSDKSANINNPEEVSHSPLFPTKDTLVAINVGRKKSSARTVGRNCPKLRHNWKYRYPAKLNQESKQFTISHLPNGTEGELAFVSWFLSPFRRHTIATYQTKAL